MATAPPLFKNAIFESKQIITAHPRHFLALSLLFLLPLSLFTTLYNNIFDFFIYRSAAAHNKLSPDEPPCPSFTADNTTVVLLLITYIAVVTVFHLLAIGSSSHSVHQALHGKPPKLISSLKSSLASVFPLLSTLISSISIVLGILVTLGFAANVSTRLIKIILPDFEFDYSTSRFLRVVAILILIKLYEYSMLAWVIVVVESTWGLTPLKRSFNLIKGLKNESLIREMRSNSLFIILMFVVTHANFLFKAASCQIYCYCYNENETGKKVWLNVALIVFMTVSLTFITLFNLASMTVSYIQCRADNGEVALEIADGEEEFGAEYVSLPFNDGKLENNV